MKTITEKTVFIKKHFGSLAMARNGIDVAVNCPNCKDTTGKKKFSINLEVWACHCWVCGIKGKNLYYILKKYVSIASATDFKNNFSNIDIKDKEIENVENVKLPKNFKLLVDRSIRSDPDVRDCLSYLKSRDVALEDIWFYKLGTCLSGKYRRRIIVPSFDYDGDLNYFCSRAIDKNRYKYINCKADKRNIIFNDINIDWKKEIIIVEGVFDLFKSSSNSTCILGSTLSEDYSLFKKLVANRSSVILALDPDAIKKTYKIASLLSQYCCNVSILDVGKHGDAGSMTKEEFSLAKKRAKKYVWNDSIIRKISSLRSGSIF